MRSPGGSPQPEAPPAALDVVAAAVSRAAGQPDRADRLRADTPLASLGIDSLGLLCVGDLLSEEGWHLPDEAGMSATTLGDLAAGIRPEGR